MNSQFVIMRSEEPADLQAIHCVHAAAFPSAAEARLVDALREGGRLVVSLIALREAGDIVGHVAFSPVELDSGAGGGIGVGLAPLAVCPSYQRKGIGSALVREGLLACRKHGLGFVVVLGEPAYYKRFGFIRADDRGLRNEFGATEEFMLLEFQPETLALPADWSSTFLSLPSHSVNADFRRFQGPSRLDIGQRILRRRI